MKLNELFRHEDELILFEALDPNKSSLYYYSQLLKFKRYNSNLDYTKDVNYNLNQLSKYDYYDFNTTIQKLIAHLNKEIYEYVSKNYKLKNIQWKKSQSTYSMYTYFTLLNGQSLGIRISDHLKPEKSDAKTKLLDIPYFSFFNSSLKEKIDEFIEKYS